MQLNAKLADIQQKDQKKSTYINSRRKKRFCSCNPIGFTVIESSHHAHSKSISTSIKDTTISESKFIDIPDTLTTKKKLAYHTSFKAIIAKKSSPIKLQDRPSQVNFENHVNSNSTVVKAATVSKFQEKIDGVIFQIQSQAMFRKTQNLIRSSIIRNRIMSNFELYKFSFVSKGNIQRVNDNIRTVYWKSKISELISNNQKKISVQKSKIYQRKKTILSLLFSNTEKFSYQEKSPSMNERSKKSIKTRNICNSPSFHQNYTSTKEQKMFENGSMIATSLSINQYIDSAELIKEGNIRSFQNKYHSFDV